MLLPIPVSAVFPCLLTATYPKASVTTPAKNNPSLFSTQSALWTTIMRFYTLFFQYTDSMCTSFFLTVNLGQQRQMDINQFPKVKSKFPPRKTSSILRCLCLLGYHDPLVHFSLGMEASVQFVPLFLAMMRHRHDQQCDLDPQRKHLIQWKDQVLDKCGTWSVCCTCSGIDAEAVCSQGSPPFPGSLCGWDFRMTRKCKQACLHQGRWAYLGQLGWRS